MIDIQAYMDGMGARQQAERSATQMTLGGLIAALESMPPNGALPEVASLNSYRGYYSDLALALGVGAMPVSELLGMCKGAMGKVFGGYRGGEFVMGAKTPLWVAGYGESSGLRLMGIRDGKFLLREEADWP